MTVETDPKGHALPASPYYFLRPHLNCEYFRLENRVVAFQAEEEAVLILWSAKLAPTSSFA